jgi:peptidyl-prolyl cis-trans isomerase SurA
VTPRRRVIALTLLLLGSGALALPAQNTTPDSTVDRIVAVVGKVPILLSQVDEAIFSAQVQMPDDAGAQQRLRRQYLDSLVAQELYVQAAEQDTMVKVTEQEVTDNVDRLVKDVRGRFKTELEFSQALQQAGFPSIDAWKGMMQEQQRRALLKSRYEQILTDDGKLKPRNPTDKELRDFYSLLMTEGGIPDDPATVSVRQIIVAPRAPDSARARARALADSIAKELRNGADFATAARRFSQDLATKDKGGELDYFRRGAMVKEFENAAFSLKPGQISDPVESPYGYHIIQVERAQPTEVQARHILIIPTVDSAAAAAARSRIDSIAAAVARGASFDSLQRLYHDPTEEKRIDKFPVPQLLQEYATATTGLDSGQVSKPFALRDPNDTLRSKWAIVQVIGRTAAGKRSFESAKDQLHTMLAAELGERAYVSELKARTYVDIRFP